MDMSLFFLPSSCRIPSPSHIETCFPDTQNLHSYHLCLYFYGRFATPIPIVVAAAINQGCRNRVKKTGRVSAVANQNQLTHKQSNNFSWNNTIRGYVKNGLWGKALRMYYHMIHAGINPDKLVFIAVINACGRLSDLQAGRKIHEDIIAAGFESDVFVGTALTSMYAKCGCLKNARQVFDRMPKRDVVSWNAIIAGYYQNGHLHEALAFFYKMQVQGIKPNNITMINVLPACVHLLALEKGKQIHSYAIRTGFDSDVVVGTGLMDMYTKCGNVNIAHKLFERMPERDVVSWSAIITGYSQNGHPHAALALFHEMQVQGIKPDSFALASVLPACAHLLALEQGKQIHGVAIRNGFDADVVVGTGLVNVYSRCGNVKIAHKLFERLSERDVASWTAIIAGYSQNNHPHEALAFFIEMQVHGIKPDSITMVGVLPACSNLMALEQGKQIHSYAIRSGFASDVAVGNALLDLYAKCGHIGIARQVFDNVSSRDVVSWNAMILAYGIHGHGADALALFSQMQQTCIKPDHITFTAVLTACSHAAFVNQGRQSFESMKSDYGLVPKLEQYACLVDILGRAGHLHEAHDIINKMPLEPDANVWGSLLGACRIHYNIELAEHAAKRLFELEPNNAGNYVLLSNIYAKACRWQDVVKVRTMMKERGVKKQPGWSSVEVHREVHTFLAGDRAHPQSEKIYAMLETLFAQMKKSGYMPKTNLVLHDVKEEVKENILCSHSEKLAISFGIINTSPGTPIRVMKNLRVCNDCHDATTFFSKIVGREIIVRDANRFHHFKDGLCSCGDYW